MMARQARLLLTVPFIRQANIAPVLTSLDSTVTVQMVHNQIPGLDNFLSGNLLSTSYENDTCTVRLSNQTLESVHIAMIYLNMKGAKTEVVYSSNGFEYTSPDANTPFHFAARSSDINYFQY